jgi:hypothetical protein
MKAFIPLVLWIVTLGSGAAPQAPAVGSVQPPLTAARSDWKSSVESGASSTTLIGAAGPSVRLKAENASVVRRTGWTAQGRFQVRATVYRAPASASTATYGLALGDSDEGDHVTFVVRTDGAIAVQRHAAGILTPLQDWIPCACLAKVFPNGSALDLLEVRVESTSATFLVNGHPVAAIAIASGSLDGTPGIQLGAGGDITVSAFTVAGDSVRGQPGRAPVIR